MLHLLSFTRVQDCEFKLYEEARERLFVIDGFQRSDRRSADNTDAENTVRLTLRT